jgi:nucleoside-diphosphate-sugar epimerase
MNVVVTGSTGFVGRHLVTKLILEKYQILELTRSIDVSTQLYGDITQKFLIDDNQEALVKTIEEFKPDVIIHLASFLTSLDDYDSLTKLLDSNISFFCRVLDATKNSNLKLFVNTGTFAEYYSGDTNFDPAYIYAATKTASRSFLDYYSKVYNFKQTTVIPYTIYGGKDTQKKIIDIISDSITSKLPIDLSPGEQILDFIHIDDVTNFYMMLIKNINRLPAKSNLPLGTGTGHTLKQVAAIIEEVTNQKTNINWGGKQYRNSDVMFAVADLISINNFIDWHPNILIKEGIEKYLMSKSKEFDRNEKIN